MWSLWFFLSSQSQKFHLQQARRSVSKAGEDALSYLNFNEGIFTFEICKTQIFIEEFGEHVYLSSNGSLYSSDAPSKMDNFNFFTVI